MGTHQTLVPDLDGRGNRRLQRTLTRYLREYGYLSAADVARRWLADQDFWPPRTWLRGLLGRPDRETVVTRAVAVVIVGQEQERTRRHHGRHERIRLGHLGRSRPSCSGFGRSRACR